MTSELESFCANPTGINLLPVNDQTEFQPGFKALYEQAFPADERRDWEQLTGMISTDRLTIFQIFCDHQFIGFINLWNLPGFIFIEHVAILPEMRSKGFGREVLERIQERAEKPVILEVEEPISSEATKRIQFYTSLNFRTNPGTYYQPPYHESKKAVKMIILSFPELLNERAFNQAKNQLYHYVYQS